MVRGITRAGRFVCLTLSCAWVAVAGCNRGPESPAAPPARDAAIVLDSPENATRSLLKLLGAQLAGVAAHDREATRRARDQVVWHVVPQAEMLRRHPQFAEVSAAEWTRILDTLVESWASAIAYYRDGLELGNMQVEPTGTSATTAVVRVPAHAVDSRAALRVTCVLDPQSKEWRVVALDLAPAAGTTQPAVALRPTTSTSAAPVTSPTETTQP